MDLQFQAFKLANYYYYQQVILYQCGNLSFILKMFIHYLPSKEAGWIFSNHLSPNNYLEDIIQNDICIVKHLFTPVRPSNRNRCICHNIIRYNVIGLHKAKHILSALLLLCLAIKSPSSTSNKFKKVVSLTLCCVNYIC